MPELPEIETIKRQLEYKIIGKTICSIAVNNPKSFRGEIKEVIGSKIINVDRRAKMLIICLSGNINLLVHLKMSGQLLFKLKTQKSKLKTTTQNSKRKIKKQSLPDKYSRVIITFEDRSQLFFNDVRKFGWVKVVLSSELKVLSSKYGQEPLEKGFTVDYLEKILSKSNKAIKLVLMDQNKIAGLGNIYANEALFLAGIRPARGGRELRNEEIKKLREAIIKILNKGIKYKGSSAKDKGYIQTTGEFGEYQNHFLVYQREGKKCKRCGSIIKKIKLGGRGTFFCPSCQK